MTLKQQALMKELPKAGHNLTKAAKNVGYSDSYAESRLHNYVKNCKGMKVYFDEETVRRDIKKVKKLVLKSKDYTNFIRATELESKILGLQIDKSEVNNKNPEKVVVVYGTKSNNDIPTTNNDTRPQDVVDNVEHK